MTYNIHEAIKADGNRLKRVAGKSKNEFYNVLEGVYDSTSGYLQVEQILVAGGSNFITLEESSYISANYLAGSTAVVNEYFRRDRTHQFLGQLQEKGIIPTEFGKNNPIYAGVWLHPIVACDLASFCSSEFALSSLFSNIDWRDLSQLPRKKVFIRRQFEYPFVYFLLNKTNKLVKVGTTTDLRLRMSTLATEYKGKDLELVQIIHGYYAEEWILHAQLDAHRVYGEWFFYSNEIKDYIANLHTADGIKLCDSLEKFLSTSQPFTPPLTFKPRPAPNNTLDPKQVHEALMCLLNTNH